MALISEPKILFLAQDGAREGNKNDIKGIEECREVVKNIDWDCEDVYYGKVERVE